jgi:small GTP-binding protein
MARTSSSAEAVEPDLVVKIIIVGDSGVGKTNIISQFARKKFNPGSKTTIGVEFVSKTFEVHGKVVRAQIWDTAGQERYRSVASAYYKGASGAIVVYDITSSTSFASVGRWLEEVRQTADDGVLITLIGNKADLADSRSVTTEDGSKYAERNSLLFMEASALSGDNVNECFQELVAEIVTRGKAKIGEIKKSTSAPAPVSVGGVAINSDSEKSCC